MFESNGEKLRVKLFERPDSKELKIFTAPVIVHGVLIFFWVSLIVFGF